VQSQNDNAEYSRTTRLVAQPCANNAKANAILRDFKRRLGLTIHIVLYLKLNPVKIKQTFKMLFFFFYCKWYECIKCFRKFNFKNICHRQFKNDNTAWRMCDYNDYIVRSINSYVKNYQLFIQTRLNNHFASSYFALSYKIILFINQCVF